MYYVYMIKCTDGSIYTGVASNITSRLKEHFDKSKKRAKYTKSHSPESLEAAWICANRSDAQKIEYQIKQLTKAEKIRLIKENYAPETICIKLENINFERLDISKIEY